MNGTKWRWSKLWVSVVLSLLLQLLGVVVAADPAVADPGPCATPPLLVGSQPDASSTPDYSELPFVECTTAPGPIHEFVESDGTVLESTTELNIRVFPATGTPLPWPNADGVSDFPSLGNILVIPDGFDTSVEGERDLDAVVADFGPMLSSFRQLGYDVVIVDYNGDDGLGSLEATSASLAQLLQGLDAARRPGTAPIAAIGPSMGGVAITRATQLLEAAGDSPVGLVVTIDSPHQGANLPFSFQDLILGLDDETLSSKVGSPAAQTLLRHHVLGEADYLVGEERAYTPFPYDNTRWFDAFFDEYRSVGMPTEARMVLTSNGACDGARIDDNGASHTLASLDMPIRHFGFTGTLYWRLRSDAKGDREYQVTWVDINWVNPLAALLNGLDTGIIYSESDYYHLSMSHDAAAEIVGGSSDSWNEQEQGWFNLLTAGPTRDRLDGAPGGYRASFDDVKATVDPNGFVWDTLNDLYESGELPDGLNPHHLELDPNGVAELTAPQPIHNFVPEFSALNIDIDSHSTPAGMRTIDFGLGNFDYDEVLAVSGAERLKCEEGGNTEHVVQTATTGSVTTADRALISQELVLHVANHSSFEISTAVVPHGPNLLEGEIVPVIVTVTNPTVVPLGLGSVEVSGDLAAACGAAWPPASDPLILLPGESISLDCQGAAPYGSGGLTVGAAAGGYFGYVPVAASASETYPAVEAHADFDVEWIEFSAPAVLGATAPALVSVENTGAVPLDVTLLAPTVEDELHSCTVVNLGEATLDPGESTTVQCGTLGPLVDPTESFGVIASGAYAAPAPDFLGGETPWADAYATLTVSRATPAGTISVVNPVAIDDDPSTAYPYPQGTTSAPLQIEVTNTSEVESLVKIEIPDTSCTHPLGWVDAGATVVVECVVPLDGTTTFEARAALLHKNGYLIDVLWISALETVEVDSNIGLAPTCDPRKERCATSTEPCTAKKCPAPSDPCSTKKCPTATAVDGTEDCGDRCLETADCTRCTDTYSKSR